MTSSTLLHKFIFIYFQPISFLLLVSTSFGSRIPDLYGLLQNPGDVCPGSDQLPTFLHHLEPEQVGLERLVVFVYRKIGSDQLISFIPSAEHQKCIQNYPETPGEKIFQLNSITIESLFQNSESKVIQIEPEQNIADNNAAVDDNWTFIPEGCTTCLPNNQNLDQNQYNINVTPQPLLPIAPEKETSGTIDNENYDEYIKFIIDGYKPKPSKPDNLNPSDVGEHDENRDEKHNSSSTEQPQEQWNIIVPQVETNVSDDSGQVTDTEHPIQIPNQWQEVVSEGPILMPDEVNEPVKIIFPPQNHSIVNNLTPQQDIKITPHVVSPSEQQQQWNPESYEHIPESNGVEQMPEKYVTLPGLLHDMEIHHPSDLVHQIPEKYIIHPGLHDKAVINRPITHVQQHIISPGSRENFIFNRPTGHVDHTPDNYLIPSLRDNLIFHQPTAPVDYIPGKYAISPGLHESVIIHHPPVSQQIPGRQTPSNLLTQWQLIHIPDTNLPKDQFGSYTWTLTVPKFDKPIKLPIVAREVDSQARPGFTFDSWLMAQLNVIKSGGQVMPSNAADISFVRNKIEEALQYHGYTVTKDGRLVDKNGVASNLSNLKLRPLLIGKSFEYHNLLTEHQDGKYKRPVTPLMEGLLLSLIKPPRILGLVTLGLTWPGDILFDENNQVHVYRREWRVPEIERTRSNFVMGNGKMKKQSGVLRGSLLKLLIPKVVPRVEGTHGATGAGVTVPTTEITPGFRIIGGSSAMGTGIPLISKGRSGLEE